MNHLATALGFQPLDRLQIADRNELGEMRRIGTAGPAELPFWFFQRLMPDGRIEVATTSGYVTAVSPFDVCDLRRDPEGPIVVRAMKHDVLLRRLSARCGQALPRTVTEDYAEAYVLRVTTDRWGRVDQCFVQFADPSLNEGGRLANAPLADGERERLKGLLRSGRFPVSRATQRVAGFGGSSRGLSAENTRTRKRVGDFIRSALEGNAAGAARLAEIDARS